MSKAFNVRRSIFNGKPAAADDFAFVFDGERESRVQL
jgi:hypothetical protein